MKVQIVRRPGQLGLHRQRHRGTLLPYIVGTHIETPHTNTIDAAQSSNSKRCRICALTTCHLLTQLPLAPLRCCMMPLQYRAPLHTDIRPAARRCMYIHLGRILQLGNRYLVSKLGWQPPIPCTLKAPCQPRTNCTATLGCWVHVIIGMAITGTRLSRRCS